MSRVNIQQRRSKEYDWDKKKKETDFQNLPSNSDGAVSLSFKHFEKGYASCSSNSVVLFLWEIGIELDWISF